MFISCLHELEATSTHLSLYTYRLVSKSEWVMVELLFEFMIMFRLWMLRISASTNTDLRHVYRHLYSQQYPQWSMRILIPKIKYILFDSLISNPTQSKDTEIYDVFFSTRWERKTCRLFPMNSECWNYLQGFFSAQIHKNIDKTIYHII